MSDKRADLPAVNWFVHVLTDNVGRIEWDERGRVVTYPLPDGKDLILEDGKYTLKCDSECTRSLVTELAHRYKELEQEDYRLRREIDASVWRLASEPPDNSPYSSNGCTTVLVYGPVLHYLVLNGICQGFHKRGVGWNVVLNGKAIPHKHVTHWRELPPSPESAPAYEHVKEHVEELRKASGLQSNQ